MRGSHEAQLEKTQLKRTSLPCAILSEVFEIVVDQCFGNARSAAEAAAAFLEEERRKVFPTGDLFGPFCV